MSESKLDIRRLPLSVGRRDGSWVRFNSIITTLGSNHDANRVPLGPDGAYNVVQVATWKYTGNALVLLLAPASSFEENLANYDANYNPSADPSLDEA